jgi:hypothetical protein
MRRSPPPVKGRGWVIATAAALLGGTGAFCGAIVNVLVGVNLAFAAAAPLSLDAAARFLVTSFNSQFSHIFAYSLYFASEYTAAVLTGVALWRSRSVPRWPAALFAVGFEVTEVQSFRALVPRWRWLACACGSSAVALQL